MNQDLSGNLLILHCGPSSMVSNACLTAVINEALNHEDSIEEILGAVNGIQGLINEDLIDLASESQQTIRGIEHTSGSALGTSFQKEYRSQDIEKAAQVIKKHNIRYVLILGNQEAITLTSLLHKKAQQIGHTLSAISIPLIPDNHLSTTDHCLGYGTLAKHYANFIRAISYDAEHSPKQNQIILIEVPSHGTGWAAAATHLAKRRNHPEDAPHLIYLPESAFNYSNCITSIRQTLEKQGWCMAILSQYLKDNNGNYLTQAPHHSVLNTLAEKIAEELGVPTETLALGISERSAPNSFSQADIQEIKKAAQSAIEGLIDGKTERIVTLSRNEGDHYHIDVSLTDIQEIEQPIKPFPTNWIHEDGASLNFQFNKYALPLIQGEIQASFEQGTLKTTRLEKHFISKK
jgi:6-phosphofructokinase